ncbi:aminoglycoside phosphotransferase family protein [uncultured Arthrobacter sp.]|uniref:aminoglycoside phosphotransferase family protein n=1 Tax=uncultured Arthrobacter sp. TaxID=114050 RepID=UPI0028D20576|nr:aminoglycoside phosphotransferase family protein [uncultured Arthrobacter sp.]
MITLVPASMQAERALARRDAALPGLPWLLDNGRLSELLGETVRVTRVRYKPGTSLLVSFRRRRNGSFDYGWAMTRTPASSGKLLEREHTVRSHGGDMRILRPDPGDPEALVAVGGVEDDWALHRNLTWLKKYGIERLGLHHRPGAALLAGSSVLRYKPERRLVLLSHKASTAVVIKAAAKPASPGQQTQFLNRLRHHGVPLLPQLADAECLGHGITASTAWGTGDLAARGNSTGTRTAAYTAGQALAALHRVPAAVDVSGPVAEPAAGHRCEDLAAQLKATRTMVSALLPELEPLARELETRLTALLLARPRTAPVLVHGDFSPDQVLVGDSEVRLIDFDRTASGFAEADLGSFAAAEEAVLPAAGRSPSSEALPDGGAPAGAAAGGPKTALLAEGYVDAGGRFSQAAVDAWAAYRLFNSSVDPFRDRSPEWAADMSWHLGRAKELVP